MRTNSTKQCTFCKIHKSLSEFCHRGHWNCRECQERKAGQRDLFGVDLADGKQCTGCLRTLPLSEFHLNKNANGKSYPYSRCRVCTAKSYAERRKRVGHKYNLARTLKTYGITSGQYGAMVASQQGACAICGDTVMPIDSRTKRPHNLAVDHCHTCNAVRSLLCPLCNNGLGCFKDDPKRLAAAISYLAKHVHCVDATP